MVFPTSVVGNFLFTVSTLSVCSFVPILEQQSVRILVQDVPLLIELLYGLNFAGLFCTVSFRRLDALRPPCIGGKRVNWYRSSLGIKVLASAAISTCAGCLVNPPSTATTSSAPSVEQSPEDLLAAARASGPWDVRSLKESNGIKKRSGL